MDALFVENEIFVNASPEEVWETLIDPQSTQRYMFGCEVICDWQVGDPIIWKGVSDGIVYVKGHLVSFKRPAIFSFTVFDPSAQYADIPENHLTATYTLTPQNNGTHLQVSQGNYNIVADGPKRYEDTVAQGGWGAVLTAIKELVESTD